MILAASAEMKIKNEICSFYYVCTRRAAQKCLAKHYTNAREYDERLLNHSVYIERQDAYTINKIYTFVIGMKVTEENN